MPSFQALRSSQLAPRAYEALLIQWSLWLGDEVGLAPAQRYPTPNRDRLRFGTLNRRRETPPPHQSSIFSLTRQLFELQLRLVKRTVYPLLQNQNRIARVGGSIRSPATPSHYFLRQPTIPHDFLRSMVAPGREACPHGTGFRRMSGYGTQLARSGRLKVDERQAKEEPRLLQDGAQVWEERRVTCRARRSAPSRRPGRREIRLPPG